MNEKQIELRVANLDCEHDAATIERGLQGFPGIYTLKVYPHAAKVRITYDPSVTSWQTIWKRWFMRSDWRSAINLS